MACLLCDKSSCLYKVGCVAVQNDKIIASGFNETLPGEKYCQNGECIRKQLNLSGGKDIDKVCSSHAEIGLIAKCARDGIALEGVVIYLTTFPCYICSKALIQAGIKKLYYMSDYAQNEGTVLFIANGIKVEKVLEEKVWGKCK